MPALSFLRSLWPVSGPRPTIEALYASLLWALESYNVYSGLLLCDTSLRFDERFSLERERLALFRELGSTAYFTFDWEKVHRFASTQPVQVVQKSIKRHTELAAQYADRARSAAEFHTHLVQFLGADYTSLHAFYPYPLEMLPLPEYAQLREDYLRVERTYVASRGVQTGPPLSDEDLVKLNVEMLVIKHALDRIDAPRKEEVKRRREKHRAEQLGASLEGSVAKREEDVLRPGMSHRKAQLYNL